MINSSEDVDISCYLLALNHHQNILTVPDLIQIPLVQDKTADVEIRIYSDAWTTSCAVSLLFRKVRQTWGSQIVVWKGRSGGKPRRYSTSSEELTASF